MHVDAAQIEQGSDASARLPRRSRTRVGKARLLTLDVLDARTAAAKEARHLISTLSTDLGGDDQLSVGERQLVTRAALLGAIVNDFETRWVAGEPVPLSEYLSAVNVQRRVLATLGLQRRAKDVGDLSLAEYTVRVASEPSVDSFSDGQATETPETEELPSGHADGGKRHPGVDSVDDDEGATEEAPL